MAKDNFKWVPGKPPPQIEPHSNAKLGLLALYLDRYFNVVSIQPQMDRLAISFVDGFSGGGAYSSPDGGRQGSPLVLLESVKKASERLNANRHKHLQIDARFYFVDEDHGAVTFLRSEIEKSEFAYLLQEGHVQIIESEFEAVSDKLIADIRSRQSAGRSVFLLDQKGWSQVGLGTVRRILEQLPRAEVLLTFAVDWLVAYLNEGTDFEQPLQRVGLDLPRLRRYLDAKGERGARYVIPRLILQDLRDLTNAPFFSPFFLHSAQSKRDLWIIHLSKLHVARNVMVQSHWDIGNAAHRATAGLYGSLHEGPAGLEMLGFDPQWEDALPLDFHFDAIANADMRTALGAQLPRALERFDLDDPPTVELFLSSLANSTAATKEQIESELKRLHDEREIEILTPGGGRKKSDLLPLKTDRVRLPRQRHFHTLLKLPAHT